MIYIFNISKEIIYRLNYIYNSTALYFEDIIIIIFNV